MNCMLVSSSMSHPSPLPPPAHLLTTWTPSFHSVLRFTRLHYPTPLLLQVLRRLSPCHAWPQLPRPCHSWHRRPRPHTVLNGGKKEKGGLRGGGGGEWEPIKIPRGNSAYLPKSTQRASLLTRQSLHSYRKAIGHRNRVRQPGITAEDNTRCKQSHVRDYGYQN
jgi:hypothetical protein